MALMRRYVKVVGGGGGLEWTYMLVRLDSDLR